MVFRACEAPDFLRHGNAVMSQFGSERLSMGTIQQAMSNTVEPLSTTQGRIGMFLTVCFTTLSLPFYGESYDGCDVVSFANRQCDGDYTAGIPTWAFVVIVCYVLGTFSNLLAYMSWKTETEEVNVLAGFFSAPSRFSAPRTAQPHVPLPHEPHDVL